MNIQLVINLDEQGVYILPNQSITYEVKGKRQVDVQNKDEKRAYTLMVASTPAGDFLPFQQVWGGKVEKSLPSKNADGMAEAKDRGFVFSTTASTTSPRSHFSTLKSMIEYVEGIIIPFVDYVVKEDHLPVDQKFILLIDVYPVHAGKEFHDYIHVKHPRCILIFIPGNCTGKFQPADVGLQRPVKH